MCPRERAVATDDDQPVHSFQVPRRLCYPLWLPKPGRPRRAEHRSSEASYRVYFRNRNQPAPGGRRPSEIAKPTVDETVVTLLRTDNLK